MSGSFMPLLFFLLVPLVLPLFSSLLARWIRPNSPNAIKELPYESGVIPEGVGNIRFHAAYWPAALLFLVFDAEAIFLFPWAVVYNHLRSVEGWGALIKMLIFLGFLALGLIYAWQKKVLRWERT
ncbi:NADH-quinone oxidoreductase subunit A [Pasteuria penetrans]|uniref:NADH-quinone oxidoreductase subunit A n=1 Tax=Pasteuria penetrans TaxID=86005 RepID=UPI000FA181ED